MMRSAKLLSGGAHRVLGKSRTGGIQRGARVCGRCARRFRLGPPSCPGQVDRQRPGIQDPRAGRPARRPRRPGDPGLPGPDPRAVRRTPRGTRTPRSPAQSSGQDRPGRRRHRAPGPAPARRRRPAPPAATAQGQAVRHLRPVHLVEQARQPGHRPRRDQRSHLQAVTAILDASQDGYHDTHPDQPDLIGDLANTLDPLRCHIHAVSARAQILVKCWKHS
jgi:hypothetical protein